MPYAPPDPNDAVNLRRPSDAFDPDHPPPLDSSDRMPWLIAMIGWSAGELARRLDIAPETARQWVVGRSRVPPAARAWLEDLAAYHLAHGKPPGWGR